jgi:hypothetical protein
MNWKLIVLLSLMGPVLALAGIYGGIGFNTEPYIAGGILICLAILIARFAPGRYFLHGFLTVLLFGMLMTAVRLLLLQQYVNHHPEVIEQAEPFLQKLKFIRSPMALIGIFILVGALLTGLLSMVLGQMMRKKLKD